MRQGSGQLSHGGHPAGVSKIRLGLAQPLPLFLRLPAVSDVDDGTHEFNEIAGWAENWMAYGASVSDFAAGMNDSVIEFKLLLFAHCCVNHFRDSGSIVRMNALKEFFKSWLPPFRVKALHSVAFLGPIPDVARGRTPCPTAGVAQPLCLGQIGLAQAQFCLYLVVLGDLTFEV